MLHRMLGQAGQGEEGVAALIGCIGWLVSTPNTADF